MTLDRYETVFIGAILIFKLKDGLLSDEENTLIFETIANQIAPLIDGFINLEKQQNLLKQDASKVFLMNLEAQIWECETYDFDLEIIRIIDNEASPYCSEVLMILSNFKDVFPFHMSKQKYSLWDFEYNYSMIASALGEKDVDMCFAITVICYGDFRYKMSKEDRPTHSGLIIFFR